MNTGSAIDLVRLPRPQRAPLAAVLRRVAFAGGLVVFVAARQACGGLVAGIAGLWFVLLPLVQEYGSMVMTEVPLALFCLAAALQFGRFLDTGRARHSFGFARFAGFDSDASGRAAAVAALKAHPEVAERFRAR